MDPKQRKEVINNLSPEERKALLTKFRNNMVMENLNIDPNDKTEFTEIYNEYLESQKQIKSQFNSILILKPYLMRKQKQSFSRVLK
jgi:hypothetical protein